MNKFLRIYKSKKERDETYMKKENVLIKFLKRESVLVIATILAIISMFFVTPSKAYMEYIDWRVLGILLSLMIVTGGLQKNGFFDAIGTALLKKTKTDRQLSVILVVLCFVSGMFITNDVALITFVPFAILIMKKCGQEKLLVPIIVLQTIGANLGSMLTPIGNPQNLYLYSVSQMSIAEFVKVMFPYTIVAGAILIFAAAIFAGKKEPIEVSLEKVQTNRIKNSMYMIMFVLCMSVVLHFVEWYIVLGLVVLLVFYMDREVLWKVDYCLLLTFISFFVFTGNLGKIPWITETLQNLVEGREIIVSIVASQVISNVPATLLLSGFTNNYEALLIGVNLGGMGTLIASMASLISYKLFAKEYGDKKGKYMAYFTIANIIGLIILCTEAYILR